MSNLERGRILDARKQLELARTAVVLYFENILKSQNN